MLHNTIHIGIIIKRHAEDDYIRVFDKKLGVIGGYLKGNFLPIGAMISYTINNKKNYFYFNQPELINIPEGYDHHTLLFFHHVFELCYFFIPIDSYCSQPFALMEHLYNRNVCFSTPRIRTIFLLKFMISCNMYLDNSVLHHTAIKKILESSFIEALDIPVSTEHLKEIMGWLSLCIKMHPHRDYFKTLAFFSESSI